MMGLDPTDGVFVNVNGSTGEMITDPNTGELKVVLGSNQPVGGGPGGTTAATASGAPSVGLGTMTLTSFLTGFSKSTWAIPALIFAIVLLAFMGVFRQR